MSQKELLDDAYPQLWDKMQRDFAQLDADNLQQFLINVENWAGVHSSPAVLAVAAAIYESLHQVSDQEAFEAALRRASFGITMGARALARREEAREQVEGGVDEATADAMSRAFQRIGEFWE